MQHPSVEGFRLSPQQERLWLLGGGGHGWRCRGLWRIDGDPDPAALERALCAVVARHEILRTVFDAPPGMELPLQVLRDLPPLRPRRIDLGSLPVASGAAELDRVHEQLGTLAWDLAQGPLQAALLALPGEGLALALELSALCADEATLDNLGAEIARAYAMERGEGEAPEPPLQYVDLAEWQNQLLESPETAAGVQRWREEWRDRGYSSLLGRRLPGERVADTNGEPFRPAVLAVAIEPELSRACEALLETWDVPAASFLLALWQVVLWRGTGETEGLTGVLHDGRSYEELRTALGPFARYLPLHLRIDEEARLGDFVAAVRDALAEAAGRQESFTWHRVAGASGFFPACFAWEEEPPLGPISLVRRAAVIDRCKLECRARLGRSGLACELRYDPARFDRRDVETLAERLLSLLREATAHPDARLADLGLPDRRELERIARIGRGTLAADGETGEPLHRLFEDQAARTPLRPAVVGEAGELAYAELNARANRLARHLRALGVAAETPVAICLERSPEVVVAILAILKAGGFWVPLDPGYPPDRLVFVLKDTAVPVAVTRSGLAALLPEGLCKVLLDADAPAIAACAGENLDGGAVAGNLAYTIYTSGSTGVPKGVQVEHRSPAGLLRALNAAVPELGRPLRASLNAPATFDASVQQLVLLLAGHTLQIVPDAVRTDGRALLSFLSAGGVDLFDCTPSQLRLLVEAGLLDTPVPVPGVVLTAGEAIDPALWEALRSSRRTVFFNLYGPTECTVDATWHRIGAGAPAPTIGRPLAGYEVVLLDRRQRPVPVGAPGEMCLGGVGLARGYSGRPALTAERFIPRPCGGAPGERLYRTGDLARWLPDGDLEFLGRIDDQIKLRGYRIEPGEIETALALHPWVEEAVVVAAMAGSSARGAARLVAYVRTGEAASGGPAGLQAEVQGFLRQRLPEYMVPAAVIRVASFPLTASGKVNRRELAARELAPVAGRPELATGFVPPSNPFEEVVAAIWQEVLGLERVGIHDSFFELGGHSLLATQVVQRARTALCGSLSVRHLFDGPTVAELAAVAAAEMAAGRTAAPSSIQRDAETPPVLSFAQQRLWFLYQMEPASGTYNIPAAVHCQGRLEPALLAAALTEIVCRHEVLRARFEEGLTEAAIRIVPAGPVPLPVIDLSGLPDEARRQESARRIREEAARPFVLEREPLLRASLLRHAAEEHVVLLTAHHIVSDAWSTALLVQELGALYPALLLGRPSPLPELPIQYADFARWQREWLSGELLAAEIAYWRERLGSEEAGGPVRLELPIDRPRPAVRSFRGAVLSFALPAAVLAGLQALSRRHGATLFMTLLGAFQALLCRYTGESDVTVGSPIAGRNHLQTESLIGFFVNTLVLRLDLAGNPGWAELVGRVREVTLGAYLHQDLPFERLVGELRPERSLSRMPLFEVMFALQNAPVRTLEVPGLALRQLPIPTEVAKFDLSLSLAEMEGELGGLFEYDRDLFDRTTVERLAAHFSTLLKGIAAGPEPRLAELPLLGATERAQLAQWGSAAGEEELRSVPEAFAEQAARTPDALAVEADGETVTYAELRRRAAGVARRLTALGVGRNTIVGLCAERSVSLVAGLLGIFQAGGAYLPLDPAMPQERLRFLLADSGAGVILASAQVASDLPETGARLVLLEEAESAAGDGAATPVALDDLAYVIYTSGSTGRPKGVLVEHGNLAAVLAASRREFGWEDGDRMPCLAPFSFDIFLFELLSPLLVGGSCVLLPLRPTVDLDRLLEVLPGATRLHAVPTLMRQIVGAVRQRQVECPRLRTLFVGGDAVPLDLLVEMREAFPRAELRQIYGPTEGTIFCTSWRIAAGEVPELSLIGRPLPGAELRLCDPWGGLVPVGALGEIWIGGTGVTRGYLGRDDLTTERYPTVDGRRFYRTGDLARWRPDGNLAFAGRSDEQVKIRGFRIEPGEIEAVLAEQTGVEAAAVMVEGEPGAGRLVAWLVPAEGESLDLEAVRAFARERLPDYMVPARFLAIERLPVTRHGKVDRKALAVRFAAMEREPGEGTAAPRTPMEEVLAACFAATLGRDGVGIEDDFFSLGGDSILVLQVVARARQAGVRITPGQIFAHPTVAALAAVAGTAKEIDEPMEETSVSAPVPLLPVQRLFFERLPDTPGRFTQALLLDLATAGETPAVTAGRLRAVLARLSAHHDALGLRFEPEIDGSWRQIGEGVSDPPSLLLVEGPDLPEARQQELLATAVAALAAGLDLARPPLVRAILLARHGEAPDRLLLMIHHLAVDGLSWRILLEDLETGWRQLAAGEEIVLPPRTVSFRRWAEHLASQADSAVVRQHARYWLEREGEVPAALPAGTDSGAVRTVRVALDTEETRRLLQEAPRAYRAQIQDLLLAALVQACEGWTGESRLWLDLEGHGRETLAGEEIDVSRTVGWLTSVFPVLLDLAAAPDPGAALKAVKEQLRAVPARGLSYGLLRFLGEPDLAERLRSMPSPEVVFNYLGQLDVAVPAGGVFRAAQTLAGIGRRLALHALEVTGSVEGGQLWTAWTFDEGRFPGTSVDALAARFIAHLRDLIAHCVAAVEGRAWGYTPSDFLLARLDQESLDQLAGRMDGEIEDIYPLSPLQHGILLHSHAPGSGLYVGQVSLTFEGELDVPAFTRAWDRVVRRHSILRTAFPRDLDEPVQVVWRAAPLVWEHLDWRLVPDPEERLQTWLEEDRRRGFDLAAAPLLRCALMRLGEDRHQFVWTHHHVLLDGWSLAILLREISALYQAGHPETGDELELAPARPFRDYVEWLAAEDAAAAEPFWRALLAGFAEPTPLGLDFDVPGETRTRDAQEIYLSYRAADGLQALARRFGLTLNTLVQGGWALLLSRYGGEEDVVFGAVSAGRSAPLAGIDDIVGLFINTLPVRMAVLPEERLAPWLERLQEQQAAARQHEHCSLARVQSWSAVPPGRRLFDSLLAFENYPVDETAREELGQRLGISQSDVLDQTDYPLTLMAAPAPSLRLKALFDPRRLEGVAVGRLLGHLKALLSGMIAEPEARLRDLPLLGEAERQQLTVDSRGPRHESAEWAPLHRRFAEVARERPDAAAIVSPREGVVTYAELAARAGRVARHLRRLGVGPDVPVGICAERSADLMVGVLATLTAGGACVPLDPDFPAERLAYMLEDVFAGGAAPVLLAQQRVAPLLATADLSRPDDAGMVGPAVVWLDAAAREDHGDDELPGDPAPDNLGYVLYTSGSTGRPKGVAMSGGALGNLIDWHLASSDLGAAAHTLQYAPLGFDVSFQEILSTWLTGGTLHLVPEEVRRDPAALLEQIGREGIERVFLPVVALGQLAEAARDAASVPAPPLRDVIVAGEQLLITPAVFAWLGRLPGCRLHNHYGPTEAHVVTAATLRGESALWPPLPSIGRPVANTDIHLLGRDLEPVPRGVAGELCIGGSQVARGYLGRPVLTAERFIPDPSGEPGARLYRTGDLARRLSDGDLQYLGRLDGQVKIRGFRVEPGEIEVTLAALPGVRQAAVVVTASGGAKRLVGFFVPEPQAEPAAAELRRLLQQRLPDPLVPSVLVPLESFPKTASGKIDRRALARLEVTLPGREGFVAPRTALEQWLAGTWSKVLQVETIGAHDDFFELGGHSLLATQVLSRVRRTFQVELPLQVCFEATTLAELAQAIVDHEPRPGQSEKIARALQRVQAMAAEKAGQEAAG